MATVLRKALAILADTHINSDRQGFDRILSER